MSTSGCSYKWGDYNILNRHIPIGSYTGLEVSSKIVEYLMEHVESHDSRFTFHHWDVRNAIYNKLGKADLNSVDHLPTEGPFDLAFFRIYASR